MKKLKIDSVTANYEGVSFLGTLIEIGTPTVVRANVSGDVDVAVAMLQKQGCKVTKVTNGTVDIEESEKKSVTPFSISLPANSDLKKALEDFLLTAGIDGIMSRGDIKLFDRTA